MDEKPVYFVNIPSEVLHDRSLPPGAKLLYGEIGTFMATGKSCFAQNKYFAELYDVSERTIRDWITQLEDKGYIERRSSRWTESGQRELTTRTIVRPRYSRDSYKQIFDRYGVSEQLRESYWKFIQHCNANQRILTNDKLCRIIIALDSFHANDDEKAESLQLAIDKGYFTVQEVLSYFARKRNKVETAIIGQTNMERRQYTDEELNALITKLDDD